MSDRTGTRIVVIFPGIGYTCDKPLLYYGLKLAVAAGYGESRKICYAPLDKTNLRGNAKAMEETFHALYAQAEEQLSDIEWDAYDEVLFLSKSIGTAVAASYAQEHVLEKRTIAEVEQELNGRVKLPRLRHILYTPLSQTFRFAPKNAIAFIGTADGWSDPAEVVALAKQADIPIEVYDNCNHSLETADVMANLERLQNIMEKTREFLGEENIISGK